MKNKLNRAKELTARYWDATISEEQQAELRELLDTLPELSDEMRALKIMLLGFSQIASQGSDSRKRALLRTKIFRLATTLSAAAAIAVVLIVQFSPTKSQEQEVYCYINGEPITDINIAMEQTKYFESLATLSQSTSILESLKIK